MQLSIKDASRFVVGAAIIRDMATANAPESQITFENVALAAQRGGPEGQDMRASIDRLAEQESAWFRGTPPHTLSTERVLHTRAQEIDTLNNANLAAIATLAFGADAQAGDPEATTLLQQSYQAAIRSIDEMPGSTADRRSLLGALKDQAVEAGGNADFVTLQLNTAQKTYLEEMMNERLAAYQTPSPERGDLDHGM